LRILRTEQTKKTRNLILGGPEGGFDMALPTRPGKSQGAHKIQNRSGNKAKRLTREPAGKTLIRGGICLGALTRETQLEGFET